MGCVMSFPPAAKAGPTAMGMDKSGTQSISANSTEAVITGWVERAGHAGTVLGSNGFVADGTGDWTCNAKATINSGPNSAITVRIKKNGTQVASGTIPFGSTSVTFSFALSLVAGDVVTMTFQSPFGAGTKTLLEGATNTYIYLAAA